MLSKKLKKHGREISGYLNNNQYEQTGEGVYFPKARALAKGVYIHSVGGQDEQVDSNLLPDEGLLYLLRAGLLNQTRYSQFYLALFGANYTPAAGLTAASFPAAAAEITSAVEGYTETTRRPWSGAAVSGTIVGNDAAKATFTIKTASQLTVHGAALLSDSGKGATTGALISCSRFASPRILYDASPFELAYQVQLTGA